MQVVSSTFSGAMVAGSNSPECGILISWNQAIASGINYFTIGSSIIGGNDIIAPTNPNFISNANEFAYQSIPMSGIVSWQTSIKLDQYPYGLVQRQADIVLNDAGKQYMPASGTSVGPYQVPNRPVIISAGYEYTPQSSETIPMFTGFSDAPISDTPARTTTLHAYDAINFINAYTSTATKPFVGQTVNTIMTALMTEMGFSANQYVFETSLNTTIPYLDPYGQLIGQLFADFCEAEGAILFADESGIIHFWNRQHFSNNNTPVWTLTYSNMKSLSQQPTSIINSVEVTSSPLLLISGVQNVYSLDQPYYIQASTYSGINAVQNPSVESNSAMWIKGTRQNGAAYNGSYSMSGSVVAYSGVPVRSTNGGAAPTDWPNAEIWYNGTGAFHFGGQIAAQLEVFAPPGTKFHLQLTENFGGLPLIFSDTIYSGNGQWQNVGLTYPFGNYSDVFNALGDVTLVVSGTNTNSGVLVDAYSDDMVLPYFDGNTLPTNIANYLWSGVPNNSMSYATQIPQYLAIQVNLGYDTFSLTAPVASGLNASVPANTSYFSFSTLSGVGGIFGTDVTANMSLQAYSVSGSTAWLIWKNSSPVQAYLTNLQLYGQIADSQSIASSSAPAGYATSSNQAGIDVTVNNASSISLYGINPSNQGQTLQINNDYVPNVTYANALANYLTTSFSTPYLRHTTDNFVCLPIQFGDAVTLVNRDTGESRVAFCIGITNKWDLNGKINQQLTFQEKQTANYFTIGTSTIGGPATIAP